jgi:hypothetical protein
MLNDLVFKLFMANPNKLTEIQMLGPGTVRSTLAGMKDLIDELCTIM